LTPSVDSNIAAVGAYAVVAGISRSGRDRRCIRMTQHHLRLYDYAASCNCYKVRLLMAHLGIAYESVPVDIFNGDTLSDDYARINFMRTTPVLETEDGRHLPESNAILFYLAQDTKYLPGDVFELAQAVRWLIYEQTDVVPMIGGLRFRLLAGRWSPEDPDAIRRREGAEDVLALLDNHLAAREFFVGGRYTIADIAIYGYTHRAHEAGLNIQPHAGLRSWLARVEQQPGYAEDVQPYGANAAPGAGRSIYG
jgi:glutathione S-transferase